MQTGGPSTRLALIGYGGLGRAVAEMIRRGVEGVELVGVMARRPPSGDLPCQAKDLAQLLQPRPAVIIECAGQEALRQFGPRVLAAGVDLVAASVGALADESLHQSLLTAASEAGAQLLVPPGAVAGLETLRAARLCGLDEVIYRGTSAGYARVAQRTVIFSGTAREACLRLPKHANITAAIALSGLGFDGTQVELVADPEASRNRHEVIARGAFGSLHTQLDANPVSATKRSSLLAAATLVQVVLDRRSTSA